MFIIKQNDTLPNLEAQLVDHEGNPINLDLCGVHFHMANFKGEVEIDRAATIVDVGSGKVMVDWQNGDTSKIGIYKAEFEVNMPDGKTISIPNDGYFLISIISELA